MYVYKEVVKPKEILRLRDIPAVHENSCGQISNECSVVAAFPG